MDLWGRVLKVDGNIVTFGAENPEELANLSLITQEEYPEAVVKISDGRRISDVQRKKAYAIMGDISDWSGHDPMEVKARMKFHFEAEYGIEDIALGTTDMTTARVFITMLIEVCFSLDIPMKHTVMSVQDDVRAAMYLCLRYRKCAICGKKADVHHIDTVGMGQDRQTTDHRNKHLVALCREHHQEAHNMGWPDYSQLNHLVGVKLDEQTLQNLGIMSKSQMIEHDRKKAQHDQQSRISGTFNS